MQIKIATDSHIAKVFDSLFTFVRKQGENVTPKGGMGGIWSAEGVWQYSGVRVLMSDGGYGEMIYADGLRVGAQFCDGKECTMNFYEGDEQKLVDVAMQVARDFGSLTC